MNSARNVVSTRFDWTWRMDRVRPLAPIDVERKTSAAIVIIKDEIRLAIRRLDGFSTQVSPRAVRNADDEERAKEEH